MLDVLNVARESALANAALPTSPASPEAMFKSAPERRPEPSGSPAKMNERRAKARYPIELEVRFYNSRGNSRTPSIGWTVNISSSGLLVASAGFVQAGTDLRVMIQWPFALDGRVPLQLVAAGVVVRSTASSFALQVRSYQFRTMKQQALLQQARAAST